MRTTNAVRRRIVPVMLALATTALTGPAVADETHYCDRYVRSLPYTISAPGHYCFNQDLSVPSNPTFTIAITIDADSVVLDLNRFTLDGSAVGSGTAITGILGRANHSHITVRNGVVRGFFEAVNLYGAGGGHTVEDVRADHNYEGGIRVLSLGGRNVVRNNVVTDTGGSTNSNEFPGGDANAFGISVNGSANVVNNEVTHTFGTNRGFGWAFELSFVGEGQVVVNNRVIGLDTDATGFQCDAPGAPVVLRDNVVLGTLVPYSSGCTKVGATNFP